VEAARLKREQEQEQERKQREEREVKAKLAADLEEARQQEIRLIDQALGTASSSGGQQLSTPEMSDDGDAGDANDIGDAGDANDIGDAGDANDIGDAGDHEEGDHTPDVTDTEDEEERFGSIGRGDKSKSGGALLSPLSTNPHDMMRGGTDVCTPPGSPDEHRMTAAAAATATRTPTGNAATVGVDGGSRTGNGSGNGDCLVTPKQPPPPTPLGLREREGHADGECGNDVDDDDDEAAATLARTAEGMCLQAGRKVLCTAFT
jgi:hypothetical protein